MQLYLVHLGCLEQENLLFFLVLTWLKAQETKTVSTTCLSFLDIYHSNIIPFCQTCDVRENDILIFWRTVSYITNYDHNKWATRVLRHSAVKFDFWASWKHFLLFPSKMLIFLFLRLHRPTQHWITGPGVSDKRYMHIKYTKCLSIEKRHFLNCLKYLCRPLHLFM